MGTSVKTYLPAFLGLFVLAVIVRFISAEYTLNRYLEWAFVLAFTSIGLDTNFRELKEQFQGGKPLTLYVVGQLFNIVLTFAAVYLLLSGKFFPLPNLAV